MPALDVRLMGEMVSGDGWNDKAGQAAVYESGGSHYRTYRPTLSFPPGGGLFVSTKIDHIRGGAEDDHNLLEMEFNSEGRILTVRSVIDFAGTPQFDTGLIRGAGELDSEKTGQIAELSAKLVNSLIKFFTDLAETGGRANFPAVIQHNLNIIAACIKEDPSAQSIYDITVVTGNLDSGGTDAGVYITLFGANGNSGQVPLTNERNNFERGHTDGFTPPSITKDLGKLENIRIWHDNIGEKPGWFLETVTVRNRATGDSWFFRCHRWLSLNDDDGLIDRTLKPESELTHYGITVVTGDRDDAGTDANVYITLVGANGDSEERLLDRPGINDFGRGQKDVFPPLLTKDLGELREVRIRHDNIGDQPGWFLDSVTVRNQKTGYSWFFPCGKWLAKDADDGSTDRTLKPDQLLIRGSDAAVYLIEAGERRWIPDPETFNCMRLDSKRIQTISDTELNSFRRGPDLFSRKDGTLLKGSGPAIYRMQDCQRRWITSPEVFNSLGLDWAAIQTISDRELDAIPRGSDLS